jgi:hypothetical protein
MKSDSTPPTLECWKITTVAWSSQAIVREMVDFPVPAIPSSQKMDLTLSRSWDQLLIWSYTSTRVFAKHNESCFFSEELNAARLATSSLSSTSERLS